ncbi:MAG: SCO6745 family protein, partial [Acidimicrobiia bacterium]
MHTPAHQARALWPAFETIHATVYFAPEAPVAYKALGLKGGWMGYFATRSAAMGTASPGLVTAVFYNFHPAMVSRALPDAWSIATPEEVLTTRLEVVDAALRRLLPEHLGTPGLVEAATLAREAAEAPAMAGRPLYGALRSLAWPAEPHLALWHAATLLREHRGDGHVAALTAAGLDGCEAHVTVAATGAVPRPTLQDNRKWSDDEWAAAEERLRARGWL